MHAAADGQTRDSCQAPGTGPFTAASAQGVPGPRWLSLRATPESVRQARGFALDVLEEVAEADPDHVDDVVLVVSELTTNAIREVARIGGESVRLGVTAGPRWTHLYAVDSAPTLPEHADLGLLAGSGRGVPIINALAAMTWIDQGEHGKTIHVVLTRTGVTLTSQERQSLNSQVTSGENGLVVSSRPEHDDALLRPREVAEMFGVRTTTIARWAREGRLAPMLTPGGHRRYRVADIRTLLATAETGVDPVMVADAVRLYEQGLTVRQVAARFERGYGTMRRLLQGHTTLRHRGGREPVLDQSRSTTPQHTP